MEDQLIRLNKYLKDGNYCSRRKADEFIAKGYVKVNGQIITEMGHKVNPQVDVVEVLPQLNQEVSQFSYFLLNKPKGYVCSKSTLDGKTIFELLPKNIQGLTYAGRLDKDSKGLVIVSNDGKFVYKVAGNEFKLEKVYIVKVNKPITDNFIKAQANGSIILDGRRVRRAKVSLINDTTYSITLTEGINRQIRRMAQNQGYDVIDLVRISIGSIGDKGLKLGEFRVLTLDEINLPK